MCWRKGLWCMVVGLATGLAPVPEMVAQEAKEEGLVGYWAFDEGQSDLAKDSSGQGNDGEIYNADWVKGKFGTALRFGGEDAYVSIAEIGGVNGSDELTVEAWVFWEGMGRYPNILTGGRWNPGGFMMFVGNDYCSFRMGRPGDAPYKGGGEGGWQETGTPLLKPFSLGKWYHLAVTFKRPTIQTYVDGKPANSGSWAFPVGYSGDLLIGKWSGKVSHNGLIDEVKIYKRALSADEIKASHEKEAPKRVSAAPGQKAYEKIAASDRPGPPAATFENDFAKLMLDDRARVIGLVDKATGKNILGRTSTLATIKKDGRRYRASSFTQKDGKLTIKFCRCDVTATIAVRAEKQYFVFEVDSLSNDEGIEELVFLNVLVKPCTYVSRMSGVAADDDFAACLRCLNLQAYPTIQGKPVLLRATCSKEHGLKGAKAALVACPTKQLRSALKEVVREKGVPCSPLGGPFAIEGPINHCSYVFAAGLSEQNVDEWIDLARTACIPVVHLSGWARRWGHYEPRPELFPHGIAGLKAVVDKIHAAGLKAGMHTLTGTITPGDPFTTPVPDPRLAKDRAFTLAAAVGESDGAIPVVENPTGMSTLWAYASRGNVIQIGEELVQYRGLSEKPPYAFTKCTRGAFGTKAHTHEKGAAAHHLYVRYGFQPDENSTLVDDVADCIANTVNECGFDLIYHDGSEGMPARWYGAAKMRTAIFKRIKRPIRVESSWSGLHHCWVFHSCVGAWDHPKWGLNRFTDRHCESNERRRRAELMPVQLGWWAILGPTQDQDAEWPDEVEYLCCKALAYDSSLSFQGLGAITNPANARLREYFKTVGRYEKLRLSGYFSEAVKARLQEPRKEFHLAQAADGKWQFLPTEYLSHKMKVSKKDGAAWTVDNPYGEQPAGLRIQALYSAEPYDGPKSLMLADFANEKEFEPARTAGGVTCSLTPSTEQVKIGKTSGCFVAKNTKAERQGAWAYVTKQFSPPIDLREYGAMGVWVYGDGKGEILNFQLGSPPIYYHDLYSEHYVTVDFKGWRYFELLLRERDAERHSDYVWPYRSVPGIYRTPLVRAHVSPLKIYYNNLPPGEEVKCYISPIKALPIDKTKFANPSVTIADKPVVFPVTMETGQYIECSSPSDCVLRNERGAAIAQVRPKGDLPTLAKGQNKVRFTCEPAESQACRAKVTLIARGEPLRGLAPGKQELKEKFRYLDQYYLDPQAKDTIAFVREEKRTISRIDGKENVWTITNEGKQEEPIAELRIRVGQEIPGEAYEKGVLLEDFENAATYKDQTPCERFVVGPGKQGMAKKGVTGKMATGAGGKVGKSCGVMEAASTLKDRSGWSAAVKAFSPPLDLSSMQGIGLWVKGDGKGAYLKVQLRDTEGAHCDYYIKLDFSDWRYHELVRPAMGKIDKSSVECLAFYLVALPGGGSSGCWIDDVKALHSIPVREVANPQIALVGETLRFPLTLKSGETVVLKQTGDCTMTSREGKAKSISPSGRLPALKPGQNRAQFKCDGTLANEVEVTIVRR